MLGALTVEQAELLKGKPLTTTLEDEIKHHVQASITDASTKLDSEGESNIATQTEVVRKAIANLSSLCTDQTAKLSGTEIDSLLTAIKSCMVI